MKHLISVICLLVGITANAMPAKRFWQTIRNVDGSMVKLMLVGDEHLHYYITSDNMPVVQEEGKYVFAMASPNGLAATDILAHNIDERSTADVSKLETLRGEWSRHKAMAHKNSAILNIPSNLKPNRKVFSGKKKGLIILLSFNDLDFTTSKETFKRMANEEGYRENGHIGSVHDYFYDNSFGKFDLTFDVVGPYKAPKSWAWYGANDSRGDRIERVQQLIRFGIDSADGDVDFRNYDWDGDGEVDQVYVIYAGHGESYGADSRTIWPHESSFGGVVEYEGQTYDMRYKVGDMFFDTYACGCELKYDPYNPDANETDGIGTMCHEFSHCLGLPDFYDTTSNTGNATSNYGMDMWDVMDQGAYNGDGKIPMSYTGYERHYCGWINYNELTEPCKVTDVDALENGGKVYQIVNPGNKNEYYLLEMKNGALKWDSGMSREYIGKTVSGIMITHVTYDEERWANNDVNTSGAGYQCMTIFHADNSDETVYEQNGTIYLDTYEYAYDLYPYSSKNKSLTDTSLPASVLNTPNTDGGFLMHKPVTNITKSSGKASFVFMNGTEEYTTDINKVETSDGNNYQTNGRIYNLKGQYVGTDIDCLPKGIYIVNAKKIVID